MKTTLQEKAYNWIIQNIYDGKLKSGDPLRVEALAEQLDISMTPVREALARLEKEGIAESIPYCGCKIRKLTLEEKEELFLFRGSIEAACVEKAVERCSEESLRELDEIVDNMESLIARTDLDISEISRQIRKCDMDFHNKIIEISGCRIIAGFARACNILAHSVLISTELEESRNRGMEMASYVVSQHRAIITAMHQGWKRAAAELVREHVVQSRRALIEKEDKDKSPRRTRRCVKA